MRTSPTQLPTYKELQKILASEATREIPQEKERVHYADFSTIIELLKSFNLPTEFFEKDFKFEDFAKKSGVKYTTLTKIESGVIKTPSVVMVGKIAKVLNVRIEELLK